MTLSNDELVAILVAQLTPDESAHSVVYVALASIPAGTTLAFARTRIDVPWDALLAFIDLAPTANWGHACRYVLINRSTGEVQSFDAQFPPFGSTERLRWHVVYQAPSVPSWALAAPS